MIQFEIVGQKGDKYYQVYYEIDQSEEYVLTEEELRSRGWKYNEDEGVYYFLKVNR